MTAEGPGPEEPLFDPEDPRAEERKRRWRERQERRRARAARKAGPPPAAAPTPPPPPTPPPAEAPSRPSDLASGPSPPSRPPSAPGTGLLDLARARRRELAALLAGLVLLWFLVSLFQPFHGEGSGRVVVQVPEGASVGEIGDLLDDRGVISSSTLFQIRTTLAGKRSDLRAGTFTLEEGMSYGDAIDVLSTPQVDRTITITLPEGLSRGEVAPIARQSGVGGSYTAASRSSSALKPSDYGAEGRAGSLEGFLFPATYELKAGASAGTLVAKQLAAFKQRIRSVDMGYARSKKLTTYDVLVIASMVEREVAVAKERRLVAAVIYNRLRDGIPLGIDATIRFALDQWTRPLTVSELGTDSPYNTRENAGLPPGPIGNPGIASIRAAADPARVDYLFYVVKPGTCGEHAFSSTEAEFNADVESYEAARDAAGGESPDTC